MGSTLQTGLAPGLALAGVLAVAGIAAARAGRGLPHLGIGALGVAAAAAAGRLTGWPAGLLAVAIVAGGAVLGLAGQLVDQRARAETGPLWPPRLLPDVAVLGLAVAVAAVLRPTLSVDLPVGPLGGLPGLGEAIVALVIGVGGALLVDSPALARRGDAAVWAAVGALVALTVVIGSGALTLRAQAIAPVFAVADVLGIGLRAAAVGVAARSGLPWGIAAAVSLGLVEGLLLPRAPGLALGFVPALILLAIALAVREPAETARA